MTADSINPLTVKSWAAEFMKEQVFQGNLEEPRLNPDAAGAYHFQDKKIRISCTPSGRDGWLNCAVTVFLVLGRWPFRKLEPVLHTGYGVDVTIFRPGHWVNYVGDLAEAARLADIDREAEKLRKADQGIAEERDANFSPIDDSAHFEK
jgi:hypothetical protein